MEYRGENYIIGPVEAGEFADHFFRVISPDGSVRKYDLKQHWKFTLGARKLLIKYMVDSGKLAVEAKDADEMKDLVRGAFMWDALQHMPPERLRGPD